MTVESLPCAECGDPVPLDMDHVNVQAISNRMSDRNGRDDFYFHLECWAEVTEGWSQP